MTIEAGRFTQTHQDHGAGPGLQSLQAHRFAGLALEAAPLEQLAQAGTHQALHLGAGRMVRIAEEAHRQGVTLPDLQQGSWIGQGGGEAAELHARGVGRADPRS